MEVEMIIIFRFGSSKRGLEFYDKLVVPGPGSYRIQGKIGDGLKVICVFIIELIHQ